MFPLKRELQVNFIGVVGTGGISYLWSFTGTYTGPNPVPGFVLRSFLKYRGWGLSFDYREGQVNSSWKVPVPSIYQELPQWKCAQCTCRFMSNTNLLHFPARTESSPGWQRRRHRTPVSRGSPLRHVAALPAPILGKRLITASESEWDLVSLNHQP